MGAQARGDELGVGNLPVSSGITPASLASDGEEPGFVLGPICLSFSPPAEMTVAFSLL